MFVAFKKKLTASLALTHLPEARTCKTRFRQVKIMKVCLNK